MTMVDVGKSACQEWAKDFERRHGSVRTTQQLREIWINEARVPNSENGQVRRAMARLEFVIFVAVLIHYLSPEISKHKLREIQALGGANVTRREYWNLLDRAHHFMAGVLSSMDLSLTDEAA